jgi:succinate dehydrogenase/fumarate reductase flavoprotein subunit
MKGIRFAKKKIETDVLCVGGGVEGLMAAIGAAECSCKVLVANPYGL